MKVIVNNIEFVFARNPYGTHDWCATDYNDEYDIEYMYCGNLEVMNFIHYLFDNQVSNQLYCLFPSYRRIQNARCLVNTPNLRSKNILLLEYH